MADPVTMTVRLLPPGQLLVAKFPPGALRSTNDQADAADAVRAAGAAIGLPPEACLVLDGCELATLTDDELRSVGLMRSRPMDQAAIARVAHQLYANRWRLAGYCPRGDEPDDGPSPDDEAGAVWLNVARELIEALR